MDIGAEFTRTLWAPGKDRGARDSREIPAEEEEEEEELALIYEAKGLSEDEARSLAARLMSDRKSALDTLSREELGIDPEELGGSAWGAAITSYVLFAVGAIVPVFPFLFLTGWVAVATSALASVIGLFMLGAATTLFTGRAYCWLARARSSSGQRQQRLPMSSVPCWVRQWAARSRIASIHRATAKRSSRILGK